MLELNLFDASEKRERHIIPISGKDSLATAIWQTAHDPSLSYEFVYNDTRAELPETYEWLAKVEASLGITIQRIGKSLEDIISGYGILPSPRIRFCTKDAKVRPMNRFIGKDHANVYFGLRADEPERVGGFKTKNLTPKYPLREAGIGLATVYCIVQKRALMPPAFFWQRLFGEVSRQLGKGISEIERWPQWKVDRAFAWRSRPNCYFCFYQRQYEWVGLLWHHPELFDRAEHIEKTTGNGAELRRSNGIHWIAEEWPLSRIREQAELIFAKRVEVVCRIVDAARQTDLFQEHLDEMDMAGVSCGLLCGK